MPESLSRAQALLAGAVHPVSFSGAGLSAESGIATFRDPGGVWQTIDPATVATPEAFAADPQYVSDWYAARRLVLAGAEPNPAHVALASDARMVHITQNIDGLLQSAGAEPVIELHGNLNRDRCNRPCGHIESVDPSNHPSLRSCPRCGDHMRPDVVWFGELLPEDAWRRASAVCAKADVLLVVGTSAEVYPAAGLIDTARTAGSDVIVVNTHPSAATAVATIEVLGPAGEVLPLLLGQ